MTDLNDFRARHSGPVYLPEDSGYDDVRPTWNADAEGRPAVIARARNVADVQAAFAYARGHELQVAVRGGKHSFPGHSTCEGGMVIDLSLNHEVKVDPQRRVAEAEAGVLWGEFDSATQAHGLAATGGMVGHTGIAGLTLGGGMGYLGRRFGLACDNLIGADMVTPDGEFVTASAEENPELFWGLRGGGGNFGVVTKFHYRLHELPNSLLHAWFIYRREDIAEVAPFWEQWTLAAPNELGSNFHFFMIPGGDTLPPGYETAPVVGVRATWNGADHDAGRAYFAQVPRFKTPLAERTVEIAYTDVQTLFDKRHRHGLRYYIKSGNVSTITPGLLSSIEETVADAPPRVQFHLLRLGGAISEVAEDATAYSDRAAAFTYEMTLSWDDPSVGESRKQWARGAYATAEPHLTGGVYVNFLSGEEEVDRIAVAHGPEKFARLRTLKERYDPENVLRLNPNIRPRTATMA